MTAGRRRSRGLLVWLFQPVCTVLDLTGPTGQRRKRVSRKTQLLGKADALQLACRSLRDFGEKEDLARLLEIRQAYRGEFPKLLLAGGGPFAQDHRGGYLFAELVVRNRKRYALLDAWMVHEYFVHLARRDFFSAAVDDFLQPSGDGDVSLGVHDALVAGAKPGLGKGLGVGLGIVLVSGHDILAANRDFPDGSGWQHIAFGIDDAPLRACGPPDRARLAFAWRQGIAGHLMRSFRHAIGFDQRHAESLLDLLDDLRRQRRRRRPHETQRAVLDDVEILRGSRNYRLVHRRYGGVPGRPDFRHPAKKFERVESRRAGHFPARRQRR